MSGEEEWEAEALRLCDRYLREVVVAFDLCPWAQPTLRAGRVGRAVCLAPAPTAAQCLPIVDGWLAAAAPPVDVGLLLFPRYAAGWSPFDGFAERIRRAIRDRNATDAPRVPGDLVASPFLVAAFHPQGAQSFNGPHQLVSFLRRTPDPMLQFVRAELLGRLKQSQPKLSDDITAQNHAALTKDGGHQRLDAVIREIAADRDATYARLSLHTNSS